MTRAPFSCGLEAALVVVGGKWKPLILFHLGPSRRRFGELRRLVAGVSEKMLSQQLRELQADGIIERRDFQEIPPKVEYAPDAIWLEPGQGAADAVRVGRGAHRRHRQD